MMDFFMNLFNAIKSFFTKIKLKRERKNRGAGISLLVPFRTDNGHRASVWEWLHEYYHNELPGAEIIVMDDNGSASEPFCKTLAFNRAAKKAKGDIFVLLDADCYIPGSVLLKAADRIRAFEALGHPLWYVPYRHFYRLSELTSADLLYSDPANPMRFGKMDSTSLDELGGISHGHYYGALITVLSRQAWDTVGGMDTRFQGWGSEDICFLKAVDTLYGRHKTINSPVYHIWHPKIKASADTGFRMWQGQTKAGQNSRLAERYNRATYDAAEMRKLVEEDPGRQLKA